MHRAPDILMQCPPDESPHRFQRRHRWVYTADVKRRDLERRLLNCGWRLLRSGGRHDVWTDGLREEAIPRHREVNERLALTILRRACKELT
jgi:mRNA interferase HicA